MPWQRRGWCWEGVYRSLVHLVYPKLRHARSYLILPGLYAKDPQLRFTEAVLSVFVVALLTAGYSFTALLCFACRNKRFQAEAVFLCATTNTLVTTSPMLTALQTRSHLFSPRPHLHRLQLRLVECIPVGYGRHHRHRPQRRRNPHLYSPLRPHFPPPPQACAAAARRPRQPMVRAILLQQFCHKYVPNCHPPAPACRLHRRRPCQSANGSSPAQIRLET